MKADGNRKNSLNLKKFSVQLKTQYSSVIIQRKFQEKSTNILPMNKIG